MDIFRLTTSVKGNYKLIAINDVKLHEYFAYWCCTATVALLFPKPL